MSTEREKLVDELLDRSRVLSTETVMFHTAIALQRDLSAVESKVLDYLARLGPLTPKALAEYAGLAPASITALIDRLERKHLVTRAPHPDDRRKVLVRIERSTIEEAVSLWDHIVAATRALAAGYSEGELRTVIGFLERAAAITHESTTRLTDNSPE
ncbi:MarR family transcriptional regulator [Amycolatopsis rhabdoformis]|uniref:MarR family transcriptional regulator n=1 Tax=Amycolatopsis rhabdoformis TaxID=1448059 RepID=A0ABZ1I333_9PSEU|nr:MarR family transcriptional regulator [Amycolatopsis rhabdoformis]WSE28202.1 MarR family transcriptional regulator [Amycolatopsis rhabdoformis]